MGKNELSIAERSSQETKDILEITQKRLIAGLVSELQLLEDERQFLSTSIKEVETRFLVFQFALNLSKSLGLRWEE